MYTSLTDLINIRFFICVVQNGDLSPLLEKIKQMLKPGGFLQWTELDRETYRIESTSSSKDQNTLSATKELFNLAMEPSPSWPVT